jgi:Flp pilus assembly protein TadG
MLLGPRFRKTARIRTTHESGQAMLEFAIIASLVLTLVFAIVDFGRAFNEMQVMIGLTRQGSNLASRGTPLLDSAQAVVAGDAPLDLNAKGEVIVTAVTRNAQGAVITGQVTQGGVTRVSKIGQGVGTMATLPAAAAAMLQSGQTIYITEVFYTYQAITPVAKLLNLIMPSTLYQAAYF